MSACKLTTSEIRQRVDRRARGRGFTISTCDGVQTAPDAFPRRLSGASNGGASPTRCRRILRGNTVLDIGCNAGFYSIEMKRRGADRVLGHRLRRGISGAGALRRGGQRARDRIPQAVRLRRRRARREVRPRAVHGRALSPAPSAAGARPDPRACQPGHAGVPVDAARQHGRRAAREDYPFWRHAIFEQPGLPEVHFVEHRYADDPTNWWIPNRACVEAMLRSAGFRDRRPPGRGSLPLPQYSMTQQRVYPVYRGEGASRMIEAVMFWNEPNNKSHWDLADRSGLDAVRGNGRRRRRRRCERRIPRCRGCWAASRRSMPSSFATWKRAACSIMSTSVAVHGFPLDWNLWPIARVAGQARRDPRRSPTCRSGYRKSASPPSAPKRCRTWGLARAPPSC